VSPGVRVAMPERWSAQGEAVLEARDGRLVAVWAGIPGETGECTTWHAGRNKVEARFEKPVGEPHESRRRPPCTRFDACGGCPLMHMEPDWQRRARRAIAKAAFAPEGLQDLVPSEVVPSPGGDEGYRHVVKLNAGRSDDGRPRLGTYRRSTHKVLPIPECNVATPLLRKVMRVVAFQYIEADVWPYEEQSGDGVLRHVVLRQSRATGQVLVTLIVTRIDGQVRRLADAIQAAHGAIAGVCAHINERPGNAMFAPPDPEDTRPPFKRLAGSPTIEDTLLDVRLKIGPGDFFQANPAAADRIATDLLEMLSPWKDRPALDLYCGVGGFTLLLAKAHGWALGAEVVPGAVARASENARLNHVGAEFTHGKVLDLLPAVAQRMQGRAPVVLLDPARRGLEDGVIDAVGSLDPSAIAYLSCNPRSMARDLSEFLRAGWHVESLRAYDMFPQTSHVEMLALLLPPVPPEPSRGAPRRRLVRP
jgi:23S rRNA (uracil1939-C5)-methyltransferase